MNKFISIKFLILLCVAFGGIGFSYKTFAQDGAEQQSAQNNDGEGVQKEAKKRVSSKMDEFPIDRIPSLFFTKWQHQSINDAKNKRGVVRPPTQAELEAMKRGEEVEVEPAERNVTLGGIVYHSEKDWTIWLNGQRVTPDAVPEEVLDLQVFDNYIDVKWIDTSTNQVFPIRLRAHQTFNLDMRIFLPG